MLILTGSGSYSQEKPNPTLQDKTKMRIRPCKKTMIQIQQKKIGLTPRTTKGAPGPPRMSGCPSGIPCTPGPLTSIWTQGEDGFMVTVLKTLRAPCAFKSGAPCVGKTLFASDAEIHPVRFHVSSRFRLLAFRKL